LIASDSVFRQEKCDVSRIGALGKRTDNGVSICPKNPVIAAAYARTARIESNHAQSETLAPPLAEIRKTRTCGKRKLISLKSRLITR